MPRIPGVAAPWVLALAIASPAAASEPAEQAPLAPRTAESGAGLTEAQEGMEVPRLGLSISVDPDAQEISGRALYEVRATKPLAKVEFDLDPRYAISEVTVGGKVVAAGDWSNPDGILSIALPAPVAAGETAEIGIAYAGKPYVAPKAPWEGGIVWAKTPDGAPWIATAIQGEGCDLFWPCIDNPVKRVEQLALAVNVPEPLVVAGNGKLLGVDEANGRRTYRWLAHWPNNYGVTLQIAPYELLSEDYRSRYGNSYPISFWYLPGNEEGARRLVGEMRTALDFFESVIGPYPFGSEKVGLAETPHLGMEHQTINAYGEGYKLAPEGFDWLMHHEFAHEWFANQLSNETNADMWLHEGFGTYMQPLFLRWQQGETAYRVRMWDIRKKILSRVPLAPREQVSSTFYNDREAGWGGDIYYKGAWVLHTLRELIGDEAFFDATRQLTYGRADPAPGNFTPIRRSTDDFQQIVEDVTGEDMDWFFEAYFRSVGLPKLVSSVEGETLRLEWQSASPIPFAMPVEVLVDGRIATVPMEGGRGTLSLPSPDAHVVLDPDALILRYDPAIDAWQKQEDAKKKAAASGG